MSFKPIYKHQHISKVIREFEDDCMDKKMTRLKRREDRCLCGFKLHHTSLITNPKNFYHD